MRNIKFSIAIPAYKAEYLRESIESCLSQTYSNFELVIVDDASPNNLDAVVTPFLKDARVRFYRNEKNCGAVNVVDNWNICLEYCTGDYVICMGDDDRLLPSCLNEYVKLIDKYPRLGVYHAWTEIIDEHSEYVTMQQPRPEFESCLSLLWNRWNGRNRQYIGDFCFDANLLKADGGFFKMPLAWGSDEISCVRAARIGGIANTQTLTFQYRQSRFTISSGGKSELKMNAFVQEKLWYESFLNWYEKEVIEKSNSDYVRVEKKYMASIRAEIVQHYLVKYKEEMCIDMRQNLLRVFKWVKIRSHYNIPILRVFASFILALLSKFHGV